MATKDNLKAAFAGESQANRMYLAFAKKAEKDGYPQAAKLFRAAAEAETVHAHAHFRVMGGINSTAENLQEAIKGEGAAVVKKREDMAKKIGEENERLRIKMIKSTIDRLAEEERLELEAIDRRQAAAGNDVILTELLMVQKTEVIRKYLQRIKEIQFIIPRNRINGICKSACGRASLN